MPNAIESHQPEPGGSHPQTPLHTLIDTLEQINPGPDFKIDSDRNTEARHSREVGQIGDLGSIPPIHFASQAFSIPPSGLAQLAEVVELLAAAPPNTRLEVRGYTDRNGSTATNLALV